MNTLIKTGVWGPFFFFFLWFSTRLISPSVSAPQSFWVHLLEIKNTPAPYRRNSHSRVWIKRRERTSPEWFQRVYLMWASELWSAGILLFLPAIIHSSDFMIQSCTFADWFFLKCHLKLGELPTVQISWYILFWLLLLLLWVRCVAA